MTPLCQRARSSCGACCGLYNRLDLSRAGMDALLVRRTEALADVPRTPAGFAGAVAGLRAGEEAPLFPSVRVCPLLGYLGSERTRVGCLGHPLVTGGIDLRDEGAYDAKICESFLCPSHAWFSESEAELVVEVCGADPFLYGLVVTDVPFVRAALAGLAALTGTAVERRHLTRAPALEAMKRLFALKEELAPGSDGLFGAFRPGSDGEPVPRTIDYPSLQRASSPYDALLTCVGADPRSGNDLDAMEEEVRRRLAGCVDALCA